MPHTFVDLTQFNRCQSLEEKAQFLARAILSNLAKIKFNYRGMVQWKQFDLASKRNEIKTTITSDDFYMGTAGIALSFAYGGLILKQARFTTLAKQVAHDLIKLYKTEGIDHWQSVGGYGGIGGAIYVFSKLYQLWHSSTVLKTINQLIEYIPELVEEDQHFDMIYGSAGCMAALISAHKVIPSLKITRALKACVAHFLEFYPIPDQFPTSDNPIKAVHPLLGFSHGVAGIAYALAQYQQIKSDPKLAKWIASALAYERKNYSARKKNWPDFRRGKRQLNAKVKYYMTAWCHGATGIGLSRIGMLNTRSYDKHMKDEINAALATTINKNVISRHALCHGDLGNLELVLQYNLHFKAMARKDVLQQKLTKIMQHVAKCGPTIGKALDYQIVPGFMIGQAGIAYQLLHLTQPQMLPNVLLLE